MAWHRLHLSFRLGHSLDIGNSPFVIPVFAKVAQLLARSYFIRVSGCHLALLALLLLPSAGRAQDFVFTNLLAQAALAEQRADLPAALSLLNQAEPMASNHVLWLCAVARRYCELTWLTNSVPVQKGLVARALACSTQALQADSNNATAHACVAACYAKSCLFADLKTELIFSQRFKEEAEKAIALDPREDIAYYLLGRWNYEIANVGLIARAYVKVVYGGLPKASNADAITNFQKAIQLAPDRILHHAGLAMAYAAAGDKKLALAELIKCRALQPTGLEDQEAQRDAVKQLTALGR
jgi:tetratricopeptide (TPR) repeat protein